jgi:hypothetical protein
MRYALGLVIWFLATSGLLAADQTKSKTNSDQPDPFQLGILIGGKSWDMSDADSDKARKNFQRAELQTPANEAIIGFLLTNPNNYDLQYTCVYRDTLLYNEKTETVEAGKPCPNVAHNTQSLYIESLKVDFTSKAKGTIQISCRLYDIDTGTVTLTKPDPPPPLPPVPPPAPPTAPVSTPRLVHPHHYVHSPYRRHYVHAAYRRHRGTAHRPYPAYAAPAVPGRPVAVVAPSAPPAEPSSPTPCVTTKTSQRIVGVQVSLQPPPSFQLGIVTEKNDLQLFDSSSSTSDNRVSTVKFQTADQPISGFLLAHKTQGDSQKSPPPFDCSCAYKQDAVPASPEKTGLEGKLCPDPTGLSKPVYLTNLDVVDNPKNTIKTSCWLYDTKNKTPLPGPETAPAPCKTSDDTRIVGVQISVLSPAPPSPLLLTMDILASGIWNQTPSFFGTTDNESQVFALSTSGAHEPIVGVFLRNETPAFGFNYKCVFRDTVHKQDVPKPVSAGEPCIGDTVDAKSLYLKELSIEPTSDPAAKFTLSCTLSDSDKPVSPCKTATDSQRIVGIQVEIQPPPLKP